MEENPAEVNTGTGGTKCGFVPLQAFGCAKGRGGLAVGLLCCWVPSAATLHHKEKEAHFFRQGSACLRRLLEWNVTGPGCVMVPWIAALLAACLTGTLSKTHTDFYK